MRESMKKLIEEMGGTVLLGGTLVQFSEESFEAMFRHVYEAGLDKAAEICEEYGKFKNSDDMLACAVLIRHYAEQPDTESKCSGGNDGRH